MAAIYRQNTEGGIKFQSERRPGEVRVPNYVYDLWLPLLGAATVGVYGVYCRLEREETVKGITLDDLARACRLGKKTLMDANDTLTECGFIKVKKPKGHKRLMHHTTEIVICDPPREIGASLIEKYKHPQGYQLLAPWLSELAEVLPKTPGSANQNPQEVLPKTSKIASRSLQPSEVKKTEESQVGSGPMTPAPSIQQQAFARTELEATSIIPFGHGSGNELPHPPIPLSKVEPPKSPTSYRWLYSSASDADMHLIEDRGKRTNIQQQHTLCGSLVQHRTTFVPELQCVNRPCTECEHIALEVNLLVYALQHVTGSDADLNRDVRELARELQKTGYKAEDVAAYEAIWRKGWQYQKNPGEKPSVDWVRQKIATVKSETGLSRYDQSYELTARIRELRRGDPIGDRRVYDPITDDDHPALASGSVVTIAAQADHVGRTSNETA